MTEAYEAGRAAFHAGADRLSCPYPAPYNPPRTPADVGLSPGCKGAFWLDGFEAANARLIAAAPCLLAALRCFLDDPRFQVGVGGNPIVVERMIGQARAAYAKATGGQS